MGNACTTKPPCSPPAKHPASTMDDRRRLNAVTTTPHRGNSDTLYQSVTELNPATNGTRNSSTTDGAEAQGGARAVMAGALDISENQMSTTHFNELESVKAVINRGSWGSSRIPEDSATDAITFVILCAHSDTSLLMIIPCLLRLYETSLIDHKRSQIVAMDTVEANDSSFQEMCRTKLPESFYKNEFLKKIHYVRGDYTKSCDLQKITSSSAERTLYFFAFEKKEKHNTVMKAINESSNTTSWTRIVLLGHDPQTYEITASPSFLMSEERIFRIDPFAGSDAVRRIVALRFGNRVLEPTWNRNHVKAVMVDFSIDSAHFSSLGDRGPMFLRDVLVDHVLGLVALVAMERPASRFGDDVRDARATVLAACQVVRTDKYVLGKCRRADPQITATFVTLCLEIDTNRWRGVPFICRVGTHMQVTKSEVKMLFRTAAGADALWRDQGAALRDNELTIRVVPSENASLDMISNLPGMDTQLNNYGATLDFLSQPAPYVPEPLERLVYDAMRGRRANFVRRDCLLEGHRILQPIMDIILKGAPSSVPVHEYDPASRAGPDLSDELIMRQFSSDTLSNASPDKRAPRVTGPGTCPWTRSAMERSDPWRSTANLTAEREMMLTMRLTLDHMRLLVNVFTREMERGIRARSSSDAKVTIKMLETFVTKLPNGSEEGTYIALDIGGTNFRVVKFSFSKSHPPVKVDETHYKIPEECKLGDAEELFDFLADRIAVVLPPEEEAVFGFTFSFPTKQESLDKGRLITWTKGWKTANVVDQEVSGLLQSALERRGLKGRVAVLINDTVGTLAAKSREDPLVRVGVILGTGTNAAFLDTKTGSVINTEWGGFGSFGLVPALPFNIVDRQIDSESPNQGEQWFEKMISGYYLGEMARRWLLSLYDAREIWQSGVTIKPDALLFKPMSLDTKHLSDVELDLSDSLDGIRTIEESFMNVMGSTLQDRILVRTVTRSVVERAARLTACAITAVVTRIDLAGTTVAVDGSLFEAHASFKARLIRALDMLGCQCPLVLSKDGSGLGAALLAAASQATG